MIDIDPVAKAVYGPEGACTENASPRDVPVISNYSGTPRRGERRASTEFGPAAPLMI
jgi:hypothetical protein